MSQQNWISNANLKQMQYDNFNLGIEKKVTPLDKFESESLKQKKQDTNYSDYIQNVFPVYIYDETTGQFPKEYFTKQNVEKIQRIVRDGLKGVRKDGKNIIVSEENVLSVMHSVISNLPRTGLNNLILMVSSMIINMIKTEYETIEKNFSFNIDVLRYDTTFGIKQTSDVKILKKRLTPQWSYNY